MLKIIFIFISIILFGVLFNLSVENFDVSKLNTIDPPVINKIIDEPKKIINERNKTCFRKPTLKYDGIWGKDKNEIYCGYSPSFQFNEEMIDGKYLTDDGCVGGDYLKYCCDDIKIIKKITKRYKN